MKHASKLTLAALSAMMVVASGSAFAERAGGMQGRGPGMMPDFATLDADGDGRVTREEAQAARNARAAALDADGDGRISLEELKAHHMRQAGDRATRMAQRMMAAMDTDGDGLLTAAELAAGPSPMAMFDRIDSNGDGAITREEAEAARSRMAARMERHGKRGEGHGRGARGHDMPRN